MRIGIDATCLPAHLAGAGRYILGLIKGLAELRSGHEYIIYCKQRDIRHFQNLPENFSCSVIQAANRPQRIWWELKGLTDRLRQDGVDLWHATHYLIPVVRLHCPVVVTVHDLAFFRFPQCFSPHKRYFFRWAIAHAVRRADFVVAVSRSTLADLEQYFPGARPMTFVYSGIESSFFEPRNGHPPAHTRPYLLAVGTQDRRKNLTFLIETFARISRDYPDLDLVLIGKTENDSSQIQATIQRHNLGGRVHCLGFVPDHVLRSFYHGASLLCHPAQYEGFGFPILEGLACQVPVLASDRPSINEIGGHHAVLAACGAISEWEAAIRHLIANPPAEAQRKTAREYAKQFDWRQTARHMQRLYEEVYQGCKRNGFGPTKRAQQNRPEPTVSSGNQAVCEAVLKTLAYSHLFQYPLTEKEILQGLFEVQAGEREVQAALQSLLRRRVIQKQGMYYGLAGHDRFIEVRRQRERRTMQLLQENKDWLHFIAHFPGVKALALSGTAAFANCKDRDDIDLFVITEKRRLWLTYSLLAVLLKIAGKRHLFCLNYLVADGAEDIQEQTLFVAHQIVHLRPVTNAPCVKAYIARNGWVRRFLPQGGMDWPIEFRLKGKSRWQRLLAGIWKLPVLDLFDMAAYWVYRRRILSLTSHLGTDSIVLNRKIIKLFTNNHLDRVMRAYRALVNSNHAPAGRREHKDTQTQ